MELKINRVLIIVLIIFISRPGFGKQRVAYYQSYSDFIKGLSTPPAELQSTAFYKAVYRDQRLLQLIQIDSSGVLTQKIQYQYDRAGNLAEQYIYESKDRLSAHYNYRPDSVQATLLWKIMGRNWVPFSENYYTRTVYDSLGLATMRQIFYPNGELIGGVDYSYDSANMLSQEVWYQGARDSVIEYYHFSYDPADSIQTIEQYNARNQLENRVQIKLKE